MQHDNRIITQLYERYYLKNGTPQDVLSSHWKYYQDKANISCQHNQIQSLTGCGFGDMATTSLVNRLFSWMTIASYFIRLQNRRDLFRLMRIARPINKRMQLYFSYDSFRQICSMSLILKHLMGKTRNDKIRILNIGDGYGFLSALIKEIWPTSQICLVDLGKILLFQAHYCQKAHPHASHRLISELSGDIKTAEVDFIYCPAEHLEKLEGRIFDVAINIASMQEMNEGAIQTYFSFLRHHLSQNNLFYCCNREVKKMRGGEVASFLTYPWRAGDVHLVDEYCPWHLYFFSSARAERGLKIFSTRIPFINYFDGPHRHRLTVLKTEP